MKNSRLLSWVPEICSGINFILRRLGSPNVDFRFQCAVDRTVFRNLKQPAFLRIIEVSTQFDFTIDAVEKTLFRFTVHAILGMNPEMPKPDRDAP